MNLKDKICNFYWNYIATPIIRKPFLKKIRALNKLKVSPTILSSNCIAGEIYSDLGMKFNSPTINLWIPEKDFIKIALNPKKYLSTNLKFVEDKVNNNRKEDYPIALLMM